MKKTLLAAALLAGFAGAAQAQSNVTLYGLVDAGFNYTKLEGQDRKIGIDSGLQGQARWGIRGSEDIGGGLKAIFTLEGIVNPFGLSFSSASVGSTFGYNDADLGLGRVNNSIYYYSPSFSGFQGAIGYSFQSNPDTEAAGNKNNDRLIDLGLKYDNGPLKAVLTYQYLNPSQLTANNGKFKNLTLGANYDFGVVAVYAGYANAKGIRTVAGYNGSIGATSADFTKDNAYTIGLSAPLGPGKAYASYQKATKSKSDNWAIGYTYDLYKRTNLYAFFVDGNVRDFAAKKDLSNRQFALGLQHRF
ncbi:MAG: hypothetical protein ABT00_22850 [Bordetella sp. SCN 68-11]|nr:MAG: hypothetical protein ABT00_22850 [Bordetella sp. SCN 68-11]